jgi:hypothetical protein
MPGTRQSFYKGSTFAIYKGGLQNVKEKIRGVIADHVCLSASV